MAKKKRKKGRRPARPPGQPKQPSTTAPAEERETDRAPAAPSVSQRQARKEQARRERERRIRRARRRQRIRRVVRWAVVIGVIGGIVAAIWYFNTRPLLLEDEQARAAAARLGCGEGEGRIQEPPNEGAGHSPPYEYANTPATSGAHNPSTYQGPPVIEEPVTTEVEAQLVHNLEHAYVVMYYRPGDTPEPVVEALTEVAEAQNKVMLAPYPQLPEGTDVAFAAWTKLLNCPAVDGDNADDLTTVAQGFIDQYRGTSNAPEPAGP